MVTENTDGSLTFRIYCPHADDVVIEGNLVGREIAGGGFGGAPGRGVAMIAEGKGWWRARLRVAPGDYTFRYVVNGQGSIPDYAAGGLAHDESGGWVSCLHVAEREGTECEGAADQVHGGAAAVRRTVTISDAELEMLLSGRRVELRVDGDGAEVVAVVPPKRGVVRALPRPDRPIERRRDTTGRVERRGQRTRTG